MMKKTCTNCANRKTIYEWAAEFKGLVVKSERDTFVCIFEQQYLENLKKRNLIY